MMKRLGGINNRGEYLQALLLASPHASASIVRKSSGAAGDVEGIAGVFFAEDLDGETQMNLLAGDKVDYLGQAVALVVGRNRSGCLEALEKIEIEYHAAPGVLDVAHAKAVRNELGEECILKRGDPDRDLDEDELSLEGSITIGSQYPVSCGILVATAEPLHEGRGIKVRVPAERPSSVCAAVAKVTGFSESQVIVEGMSIRGGAGGRGDESVRVASLAAILAVKLGRPVSLELDAAQELALAGKRHAVEAGFRVAYDKNGVISVVDIDLVMDGGAESGNGQAALERAMLNVDGVYGIANFRVKGRLCRTNGLTGDSIAAEGSAQGILVMEEIIARVARKLGGASDTVRELNFYRSKKGGAVTPYGQKMDADLLSRLWVALLSTSKFHHRREEILKWNQLNHACKRGMAAVPIKLGIGDLDPTNNQVLVCVQVLSDGSVRAQIGAVDVGEGLLLRAKKQISEELGVAEDRVEVGGNEDGNLNPSLKLFDLDAQTLIRGAVKDACDQLNGRLGKRKGSREDIEVSFIDRVSAAGKKGKSLITLGFFKQAGTDWDGERFHGSPFAGFFYGGAVIEVELDAFTGEVQVLRADLFCEGGETECADWDRSQISRLYMMGQGWMLNEEMTDQVQPYAVPGIEEAPIDFRIELVDLEASGKKGQKRISCLCAEAPVAMVAATREALKQAIFATVSDSRSDVDLPVPAGPDVVMHALIKISREAAILKRMKGKRKKSGEKG